MNGARDFVQHISEITPPETNSKMGSLKMVSFLGQFKTPIVSGVAFCCSFLGSFLGNIPPKLWGHSSPRFTMSKFPCFDASRRRRCWDYL